MKIEPLHLEEYIDYLRWRARAATEAAATRDPLLRIGASALALRVLQQQRGLTACARSAGSTAE